jgi:SAM-dependent methyltransferase
LTARRSRCGHGRREDWNRRYAETEFLWTAEPNRFLVAEVAELVPGRALDLACGEGRNAVWLARQGWRVTAVDFSEVGLAKAERLANSRGVEVDWVLADVIDYRPPQRAFDLVVILYLQLPAERRRDVLRHAAQALVADGTLLVVGHDLTNLTEGYGGPANPAVLFTPEQVAAELPGLTVERADRVKRPVDVDGTKVEAIDALVRARRIS